MKCGNREKAEITVLHVIKNDYLTVEINDVGASLWSIKDRDDTEYLWQGDATYWGDRAPNLFPYIGRMTEGQYRLSGETYKMNNHGFARNLSFNVEQISDTHIVFSINNTSETYKQYPYQFVFSIIYKLEANKINITYYVRNYDNKTMYFGVGGHPGFNVPFEKGIDFEEYCLEFDSNTKVEKIELSEDCFVTEKTSMLALEEGNKLTLRHDLFDNDAIVMKNMSQSVALVTSKGNKGVRVTYPDMSYLGIWHVPKKEAPYICIEPWSSLPSRKGIVEELEKQPSLISLNSYCEYENHWSIELIMKSHN